MQETNIAGKKKATANRTRLLMPLNGSTIDLVGTLPSGSSGVSYLDNQKYGRKGASFTTNGYIQIPKNAKTTITGDMTIEFTIAIKNGLAPNIEQIVLSNKAGFLFDFMSGVAGWNNGKPCWMLSFSEANDKSKILVIDAPWTDGVPRHFAAARSNGVWTIYFNGVAKGTIASSIAWDGTSTLVGNYIASVGYGLSNNCMQDLRLSDYCRYSGPFAAPSSPFELD